MRASSLFSSRCQIIRLGSRRGRNVFEGPCTSWGHKEVEVPLLLCQGRSRSHVDAQTSAPLWSHARRLNALSRDFTANALLYDPFSRTLVGGQSKAQCERPPKQREAANRLIAMLCSLIFLTQNE